MKILVAFIKGMRPWYSISFALGLLVIGSHLIGGEAASYSIKHYLGALSLCLVLCAAYLMNDICDIEFDKTVRPKGLLVSGSLSKQKVWSLVLLLSTGGIFFASLTSTSFLVGIIIVIALLFIYNHMSKAIGPVKGILVAVLMSSVYPLSYLLFEAEIMDTVRLLVLPWHWAWIFLTALSYEMFKDIWQAKSDAISARLYRFGIARYSTKKWFNLVARSLAPVSGALVLVPMLKSCSGPVYTVTAVTVFILSLGAAFTRPKVSIGLIFADVVLVTSGSFMDVMIFGS